MTGRSSGVVTFLFTDIEGSTRLLRELGPDRYGALLEEHRRLLREQFSRHDGSEEGTEGDSFLVVFASPREAVAAAAGAQAALESHPWSAGERVHVRIGIHSGEASASAAGYVGVALHRAARIAAAGHGDQVLVSQATVDLLRDLDLPYRLIDLGAHRLKDLSEPQHIYQLEATADGPIRQFPSLRTVAARATNLPSRLTPLIGRQREVHQLTELILRPDVRVVTLTGPGGIGKTRLALEVGSALLGEFKDGGWFVPLGAVTDAQLVVPAVADALALNEAAGQSLAAFLSGKQMLLLLDNFEQVVEAAPDVAQLQANAPLLKVLVTSREALRISGERVFDVPPLGLPNPMLLGDPEALMESDAVGLFVQRAQDARPDFALTAANGRAVAEICVRLDGLPLAIELAAARVTVLSPEQILSRLGDRLRLLTTGARDAVARHQTLRATLEWSYDLLSTAERDLFAQLAVFSGGFTLDAAESVADAEIETLGSLVDKSLIRSTTDRFGMLETIREYAVGRLDASSGPELVRDRHAAYFADLAARAYPERITAESDRSAELETDIGNLRVALDRLEVVDQPRAIAMAGHLGWFWHVRSHLAEGRARLEQLLARPSSDEVVRARALAALGEICAWQADPAAAQSAIDEAAQVFANRGLQQDRALALYELGWAHFIAGDNAAARAAMEQSVLIQHSLGDELLMNRAQLGLLQVLVAQGDVDTVEPLARQSLEVARRLRDLRGEHFAQHFLADSALIRGDAAAAFDRYRDALRAALPLGDRVEIATEVQGVAMSIAGLGQHERAVKLAAAADAEFESVGVDLSSITFWMELLDRYVGNSRAALSESTAIRVTREGRATAITQAVSEALDASP